MGAKGVIFDLDGTLLDTLDDLADSVNAALVALGMPTHARIAYRHFVGDGMRTLAERVLPASARTTDVVARCVEAIRAEYGLRWADKTRPYAGVPEMLTLLEQHGVPMAVLSNKPEEFTKKCVARMLPAWRFAVVRGAREGEPLKPDPRPALAVARMLGAMPCELVYVGDTATDMLTGRQAGMYTVGVLWGFRDEAELRQAGAHTIIRAPQDIATLVL